MTATAKALALALLTTAAGPALAQTAPEPLRTAQAGQTGIDAETLTEIAGTLASDQFEGRAPGTAGEDKTIGYLIGRFEALGLEPGGVDGSWTQAVPLLHTQLGTPETLQVTVGGRTTDWAFPRDVYVSTLQPKNMAAIDGADMVFVGYGVAAPE
ncbi:MAG: peptidase M20, partial [Novosphingopyxis baekryungensis]|nr:peptidase M20 [Novosphingopyxis baekryungensis]